MNIELFKKIKSHIRKHPSQVNMDTFCRTEKCGTVGCIAGWALMLSGINPEDEPFCSLPNQAMELLDVDNNRLFYEDMWPQSLFNKLMDAKTKREYAKVCCQAIDSYIEYGGGIGWTNTGAK